MAVLLGPSGFGLFGVYGSIEIFTENIAGMGVNSSGVRQIAEAAASGDELKIARTVAVLRRTSLVLGLLGAVFLIICSRQVSIWTFGGPQKAASVCLLSLAVLFQLISYGQDALIQGMRRIADLARAGILGSVLGTIISIPVIYFLRADGVALSFVIVAAMNILISWWYSRKIRIQKFRITTSEIVEEASALLKLGSVFMVGALLLSGVAYLIRLLIIRKSGLEAAGLYQSAWTLGGLYIGLIVQAMGADFYPRLSAAAADNKVCNRLVNEQVRVGMLLACPGVIATLCIAPIVTTAFYSSKFHAAIEVLRWICIGTTLQVVTWPMGFILVAKGRRQIFFWCELSCAAVYALLSWLFIYRYGLDGAGIAFLVYGIFHGILHYPIVRYVSGFRWSISNVREGAAFALLIGVVDWALHVLPTILGATLGIVVAVLSGIYSIRTLTSLTSIPIPKPLRKIMISLGVIPADAYELG